MNQTIIETNKETPKRYQCRHIFTDGHRCGSACLRNEELCYYHHTTRRPAVNPRQRRGRRSTFDLSMPEDRSAIQTSIGEVLQRIASNDIDPRRAGLLLYGLQIASLNLPRLQREGGPATETKGTVEEIVSDPELGTLAPRAEVAKPERRTSVIGALLEKFASEEKFASQEKFASETQLRSQRPQQQSSPPSMPRQQSTPGTSMKRSNQSREPHSLPFPRNCHFDRSSAV
jgi:hypothetical protein